MAESATGTRVIDGSLIPNGYVQMTSLSTAVGLTSPPAETKLVMLQAETNDIRWRDDGVDPTTTVGFILKANATLFYNGRATAIKFIETTASAKLNISYYK